MAGFKRFEEIEAWQQGRALSRELFRTLKEPQFRHEFVIRDQLIRAGISVPSNIAEGFGRNSHAEFARFLDIARGSSCEVQSTSTTSGTSNSLQLDGSRSCMTWPAVPLH